MIHYIYNKTNSNKQTKLIVTVPPNPHRHHPLPDHVGADADGPTRDHGYRDHVLVGLRGLARDEARVAEALHAETILFT